MNISDIKYIDSGPNNPIPCGRERGPSTDLGLMREAIKKAKHGQSFVMPERYQPFAYRAAQQVKVKITTRRIGDGKLKIWRIS